MLSTWEWGGPTSYIHDEVATDKRNPTVNANGRVYGVDFTGDQLLWVDPREHASGQHSDPGDCSRAPTRSCRRRWRCPSPYLRRRA